MTQAIPTSRPDRAAGAGPDAEADAGARRLEALAAQRRRRAEAAVRKEAQARGQTLLDGRWIAPDQVRRRYRRLWWASLWRCVEILFACLVIAAAAGLGFLVLAVLAGLAI